MPRHRSQPTRRLIRELVRSGVAGVALALVALHVWIFCRQWWSGDLLDAETAMRWLGAGALGLGALWLRRQGLSLWRGRSAAVFWLSVLLLHAGVPVPSAELGAVVQELPAELMFLLSIPVGSLWLLSRLRVDRAMSAAPRRRRPRLAALRPTLASCYAPLLRRPPPF